MKKLFLLYTLLCITILFGQQSETISAGSSASGVFGDLNNSYGVNNGTWVRNAPTYTDIEGTYYLFESWGNKAEIYDLNNKGYKLPSFNYNIKLNRIETQIKGNEKIFAFNSKDIYKFKVKGKLFVKKDIDNGLDKFYEVIYLGTKLSLYKLYETKINTASINPMTQQKIGKDKINIISSYYVEKDDKMKSVKVKKSTILGLMANKKSEVKSFIKKNDLSLTKDLDLNKIFKYYNEL